jgi:outer membrane protein assembly factor BamA
MRVSLGKEIQNVRLGTSARAETTAWLAILLISLPLFGQKTSSRPPAETPEGRQRIPAKEPASTAPQVQQVLPSYEGQNVSSVEIAGRPDINSNELEPLLAQKAGEPFARAKVEASIAALKNTGRFEDVQIQIVPDLRGIRVLLVLQPGLYFGMYDFPGARGFAYSRLLQVANYPPEGPYSAVDVSNAAAALVEYFQQNGFFQAQVKPEVRSDGKHGLVNVFFHTTLNKKARFGEVKIEGATPRDTELLKGKLTSLVARLRGSAIRPGKTYRLKTVQNATQRLEDTLIGEDRLAGQVKLIGANYDPSTNRADIAFHVTMGPIIHAQIEGARVWSWTRHKLLPIYAQVGTDPEIVQEGRQNLISYFQNKGYFDAQATVDIQRQNNGNQNIVYTVKKGARHKVEKVEVAGNQAINDTELLSHLAIKKAPPLIGHGNYSRKLLQTSVKNLEGVYRAAGFNTVKVTPRIKNEPNGNIEVTFNVAEGPRDIVETLTIDGNDTMPVSQLAPQGLKIEPGKPYSQTLVDNDRNQIMARYLNAGYLTATFREVVRAADNGPHRLNVVYRIYEGPRVTTNSVITIGRNDTQQAFINRTAPIRVGAPLTAADMLTAESRLYEPNIFDWAEVDPRRQITTQNSEDVVIKVHEAKENSLTYGFGFEVVNRGGSIPNGTIAVPGIPPVGIDTGKFTTNQQTFYGPRGHVEYTRSNFRGKAETITVSALAGRLDQRFTASYQDPHLRYTNWASTFNILGEYDETNPIFSLRRAEAGYQLQRNLFGDKNKNLFLRYSFRETGITHLLLASLVPPQDQHTRLSTLSASFIRDTRDNVLDAHKGIYESFELAITPEALGSNVSFARLQGQTSYYKHLPKDTIWANSLRIGFLKPFSGSHVPITEQFFSGGGSTLRGFALNGAGPQRSLQICNNTSDPACFTNVPTGGNQLFIVNSEFRIPVPLKKGLSAVPFYDGGNVFRTIGFHGQYTNTIGFGIRYATPVGPVRLDIGHNLNAPPGVKSTQYFITLGQAF